MNFTAFDIKILITMVTACIVLSIVFTGLGMSEQTVSTNDVPELDISSDRFDLIGDFPDYPSNPSSGKLQYYEDSESSALSHSRWLDREVGTNGNTISGTQINFIETLNSTASNREMEFNIFDAESGNISAVTLDVGETATLNMNGYEVVVEFESERDDSNSEYYAQLDWELASQPGESDFLTRIPVVSTLYSVGQGVAAFVGWIGSILLFFCVTTYVVIVEIVSTLFKLMVFFLELLYWMNATYLNIMFTGDSFVALILFIPAVLVYIMVGKLVLVAVSVLPTT